MKDTGNYIGEASAGGDTRLSALIPAIMVHCGTVQDATSRAERLADRLLGPVPKPANALRDPTIASGGVLGELEEVLSMLSAATLDLHAELNRLDGVA